MPPYNMPKGKYRRTKRLYRCTAHNDYTSAHNDLYASASDQNNRVQSPAGAPVTIYGHYLTSTPSIAATFALSNS